MDLTDAVARDVPLKEARVWWLGGGSVAVRTAGGCMWIDPFFGTAVRADLQRLRPPLIDAARARPVSAVLITHEHNDHCHVPSLAAMARHGRVAVYAPPAAVLKIEDHFAGAASYLDLCVVSAGFQGQVGDVSFQVLPGNDPLAPDSVMYLVQTSAGSLLHPGDSLYTRGFFEEALAEVGCTVDIAFFAVGNLLRGTKSYMTPEEFARASRAVGARLSIPIHWDLWEEAKLEPWAVDPKEWGDGPYRILTPGKAISLPL